MRSKQIGRRVLAVEALAWVAIGLSAAINGCGSRDQVRLVTATGRVTLNNDPVVDASVIFEPASRVQGKLATGRTNAQGEFVLYTDNRAGAVCGNYKAAIVSANATTVAGQGSTRIPTRDPSLPSKPDPSMGSPIPGRYRAPETSGLVFEVSSSGTNKYLIRLVIP